MPAIVLKAKLDEFLARRVEKIIERGMFENEEEFLKGAIKEMVRKYEIQELNKKELKAHIEGKGVRVLTLSEVEVIEKDIEKT